MIMLDGIVWFCKNESGWENDKILKNDSVG